MEVEGVSTLNKKNGGSITFFCVAVRKKKGVCVPRTDAVNDSGLDYSGVTSCCHPYQDDVINPNPDGRSKRNIAFRSFSRTSAIISNQLPSHLLKPLDANATQRDATTSTHQTML
jgi:hypothetical protein